MSIPVVLLISFCVYIALLVVSLYLFVFGDPQKSALVRFWTETLPTRTWKTLERFLGRRPLQIIEGLLDRALMLVYVAIICGAWSIVFVYIYPWIDRQQQQQPNHTEFLLEEELPSSRTFTVSSMHKNVGYIVLFACVASWRLASRSSPGLITAQSIHRYNHFPYDHFMYVPGQICKTRRIPRLARSKFDRYKYHQNIPRFDHYCGWVYNTIGEENYRFFLLFLLIHIIMCFYGSSVVGMLFYGHVLEKKLWNVTFFDRFTGQEIESSKYIVFQYLFHTFLLEAALFILTSVMGLALTLFLAYHIWLTSRGLTTNESYKWDQIMRWYNRELEHYNSVVVQHQRQALENGEETGVDRSADANYKAAIVDSTLEETQFTPTATSESKEGSIAIEGEDPNVNNGSDDSDPSHPGPKPVNIYNRGFVENWKEVIFPLSLRKKIPANDQGKSKDN